MLAALLPLLSLAVVRVVDALDASPTTSDTPPSAEPASQLTVSVPLTAPSSAPTLDPALTSFSIEQDRWTDWAGESAPNAYFRQTLQNLQERSGAYPWIRIGANSEDHTDFNPSVEVCLLLLSTSAPCFFVFGLGVPPRNHSNTFALHIVSSSTPSSAPFPYPCGERHPCEISRAFPFLDS